ncbi:cytochrome P450 4c3-like [Haemaphysalis longicornis]
MSVLAALGFTGLRPDSSWVAAASNAASVLLRIVASCAVVVGALIWVARIKHSKTLKQLQTLPQVQQHFPFQSQWIVMRACDQPMSPAGFSALIFAAATGLHETFRRFGWFLLYNGFRPVLTVYKAEYVEEILSSNNILNKGYEYALLHSWLGTGLLTSDGDKWRSRRRLFTPAFHFRILDDFMGTINNQSFILATKLGKLSRTKEKFNVLYLVTMCTLDTICETVMGTTISAQSNENSPYVIAVSRLGELFLERVFRPLLHVNFIFKLSSVGREYAKCLDTVHSFTRKVIAERKEALRKEIDSGLITLQEEASSTNAGRKTSRPFMDLLLLEHFKGNISEDGIREEVDTFMFAGHDTTASGITWALFLIGHHPREQQLIHNELDSVFGDDKDRYVTTDDLKKMKYLECGIKESQRIYPSVPVIARSCAEPFTIGGVTLPQGSVIQITPYFLHRDPKTFPKPEEFRPERFLPENANGRHPYAYVPFSAGPRNCIGQKFALAEEKIVLANILRRFKVKSLDQRDQVELVAEIVLRPRRGLNIRFTPR